MKPTTTIISVTELTSNYWFSNRGPEHSVSFVHHVFDTEDEAQAYRDRWSVVKPPQGVTRHFGEVTTREWGDEALHSVNIHDHRSKI